MAFVDTVKTHGIRVKRKTGMIAKNVVNLMTAHKSKGMEFDYVYIIGATDGHWGGRKMRDKLSLLPRVYSLFSEKLERNEDEDERHLFFVALTRAKKHAVISYAKKQFDGTILFPSQFVNDLDLSLVEKKTPIEFEESFSKNHQQIFVEAQTSVFDIKTKEFVSELFNTYGLSVTGLNNYLSCPWRYFYMNLLRIPKVQEPYLMFGTAIHAALKDFFDTKRSRDIGVDFIKESFTLHLRRQDLSERDAEEFLARGITALSGYLAANDGRLQTPAKNEFEIGRVLLGDIPLTGKIDRIEFLDDGGHVHVVDYKTGKPKSRNDILGETKTSEGNMIRQLIFYKLLLSLYDNGVYDAVSGEINFVEPTETGNYRHEQFALENDSVEKLSEEIKRVTEEIRSLAFWNTFCDDKDCGYCAVRRMM
jgi:DNA helicase-2/ATP-dependent DNA helicase PcrA